MTHDFFKFHPQYRLVALLIEGIGAENLLR